MTGSDALVPLAQMLTSLPDESVEGLLYSFEAVVNVSGAAVRPTAAQMLRDSAAGCASETRRDRLLRAAADVAAGQPCAAVPQQFTEAVVVPEPIVMIPEEQEEDDDDPYMEDPPPPLPHLPVRQFFPEMVVRVGRDFVDAGGLNVCEQDLLKLFAIEEDGDEYTLSFLECTVRLTSAIDEQAAILENAGNAWFQPVPTVECLEDLAEAIDRHLDRAEDNEEVYDEDDEESFLDTIEELRAEVAECLEWIVTAGDRGPAPEGAGVKLAEEIFGPDDIATAWCRLFFAAVPFCMAEDLS